MPDHVHMCLSIPPKYSVPNVVGFIKGKSVNYLEKHRRGGKRISMERPFGHEVYYVSTVGLDEDMIKEYIRNQEKNDIHREQLKFEM